MKSTPLICIALLTLALPALGKIWTSTDGKTVEADVVKVNPDKTVVLKTNRGSVFTVPFNTFIPADVADLETRLALPFDLHPVSWQELNALFGVDIWSDPLLWDDPTQEVAKRMNLKKESKTKFMENYRAYPRGQTRVLNEPVFAAALYGGTRCVESISFFFLNQGDISLKNEPLSPDAIKAIERRIEESGMHVHNTLLSVLGEPKRDSLGKGDMREKVYRWDWNDQAIMLSMQEGKYSALRIMPAERADRSGRVTKLKGAELKQRMASCVERRDNGDVVIQNIPMIDQGPKGYCSPATWERYLRYIEIPADMYLLALAGNTKIGGGTSASKMMAATQSLISANGRELEEITENVDLDELSQYIDKGLPIMWRLISTPSFQLAASNNTARRNGKAIKKKNNANQSEDSNSGGHICLIIGYNKQTGEIAISDSWGPRFAERWVSAEEAQRVSNGSMAIIKW